MDIYHYHPDSGALLGQSSADPSPLEPGEYLIPSFATTVAPPAIGDGKRAVWSDGAWRVEDIPAPDTPPPPTEEQIIAALTADVQAHLDAEASTRGYDGILSLCTYASDPDPVFAAEGQAGVAWRGAAWRTCYAIMSDVKAEKRPVPTAEELLAELPPMVWP